MCICTVRACVCVWDQYVRKFGGWVHACVGSRWRVSKGERDRERKKEKERIYIIQAV